MPNWSFNSLKVTGNKEEMDKFFETCLKPNVNGDLTFKFSNLLPMPVKIKNTISPASSAIGKKWINEHEISKIRDSKIDAVFSDVEIEKHLIPCENNTPEKCESLKKEFGSDNWYDWNIQNFGTKWDVEVEEDSYFINGELFECRFDTAWSPPVAFLVKLQQQFEKLDIRLTYEIEGYDQCGVFYTDRTENGVQITEMEGDILYESEEGEELYYDREDGEFHYVNSKLVCNSAIQRNPFGE